MNVIYLTQVFEVGCDPGSERHFYFCKYLVRQGHTVTAITSNVDYKKAAVKFRGEGWLAHRQIEGVDIHYVYSYANFRGSFVKRLWYYATYFFAVLVAGSSIQKPDIIYAVSTPLTVGLLGYLMSWLKGVPFVFEVTDVWPDAAVVMGIVKNPILIRIAHWLELLCYRKAVRIIALTEGIRDNIVGKGISADKVVLITNGVDISLFRSWPEVDTERERLRQQWGFDGHFVCMYLGAHGAYNALETIIEAAEALHHDSRYLCVLVGDGDAKARLQAMTQERALTNVRFLPPVPRDQSPSLLRTADAFLLPNRRGEFFAMNLPNKLFDFLASGWPVIVAGQGESSNLVQRAGAGCVVPAEDGRTMATAIAELAALGEAERAAMGEMGRCFVIEHYNRDDLSRIFMSVLECAITG